MKTAIEQAIDLIEERMNKPNADCSINVGLMGAASILLELLPAERAEIEDAVLYALDEIAEFGHNGVSTASDYFDKTYSK